MTKTTTRRTFLTGTAAGIALLAGCTGGDEGNEGGAEAQTEEEENEQESEEEAGNQTEENEQEGDGPVAPRSNGLVVERERVAMNEVPPTVYGQVKNYSHDDKEYLEVMYRFYNFRGEFMGRFIMAHENLEAGGTWEFELQADINPNNYRTYDVMVADGGF